MIRFLHNAHDSTIGKRIAKGEIVDLGNERNVAAVKKGLAEWAPAPPREETEKKEETPAKISTSAKGKKIETK